MDTHKFFVEKMRFHLKEQDTLVFVGWFFDGEYEGTFHQGISGQQRASAYGTGESRCGGPAEIYPQHQ